MKELTVPDDDGLLTPPVSEWSRDKHFFLRKYIGAFTTAMRKKWSQLHYIDLFAGAGIEQIENTKQFDWGSPLIAAQADPAFDMLHLCEKSRKKFDALRARLGRFNLPNEPQVLHGDANSRVQDIIATIPTKSLCLAFLDPYGLHLHFETLRSLSSRQTDLIIFFPDHLDALRNWKIYARTPSSNLDKCFGEGIDWRTVLFSAPKEKRAAILRDLYIGNIKNLGYTHFAEPERILRSDGHPMYLLIFCSKHPLGADIWRRVSLIKRDSQRTFDFGG